MKAAALRAWAEDLYERHGPAIAELVGITDIPPIRVHVARRGPGAAWTSGTDVYLSAPWFAAHPDDVGACLHEFTHAIMRAPIYDDTTSWLLEGLADWIRDALGFATPWTYPHLEPDRPPAGYQSTAHFLLWLEPTHPGAINGLSRRLCDGTLHAGCVPRAHRSSLDDLTEAYRRPSARGIRRQRRGFAEGNIWTERSAPEGRARAREAFPAANPRQQRHAPAPNAKRPRSQSSSRALRRAELTPRPTNPPAKHLLGLLAREPDERGLAGALRRRPRPARAAVSASTRGWPRA